MWGGSWPRLTHKVSIACGIQACCCCGDWQKISSIIRGTLTEGGGVRQGDAVLLGRQGGLILSLLISSFKGFCLFVLFLCKMFCNVWKLFLSFFWSLPHRHISFVMPPVPLLSCILLCSCPLPVPLLPPYSAGLPPSFRLHFILHGTKQMLMVTKTRAVSVMAVLSEKFNWEKWYRKLRMHALDVGILPCW